MKIFIPMPGFAAQSWDIYSATSHSQHIYNSQNHHVQSYIPLSIPKRSSTPVNYLHNLPQILLKHTRNRLLVQIPHMLAENHRITLMRNRIQHILMTGSSSAITTKSGFWARFFPFADIIQSKLSNTLLIRPEGPVPLPSDGTSPSTPRHDRSSMTSQEPIRVADRTAGN